MLVFLYCLFVSAFSASPLLNVQYWGQNSAGAGGAGTQGRLREYCTDDVDVILLSFLVAFGSGRDLQLNFANQGGDDTFPGTQLLHVPQIGEDIKYCQSKGKQLLLSLGGASGAYGFSNDSDATSGAEIINSVFGVGSSGNRPFDDAVVDGYDLDIEGGTSQYWGTFINRIKEVHPKAIVSAAPQCLYPDGYLGAVLNTTAFDYVLVQFYNNWCNPGPNFNFNEWDNWAQTVSKNKDVRVMFGTPGSSSAAGSGYVGFSNLTQYVNECKKYPSFGGISMWDASQSFSNKQSGQTYSQYAKSLL